MSVVRAAITLALLVGAAPAVAQTPSQSGAARPVRVVVASGRLPSVVEAPLHFKLVRLSLPAGQSATHTGPDGMLYVMSGALDIRLDSGRRTLRDGAAIFTPARGRAALTATGGTPVVALHFMLVPTAELDGTGYDTSGNVAELYRAREPLPNLKSGMYEFTMTRVTVEKGVPRPPMHTRSGGALYYVQAGVWTLHMEGKSEPRARGTIQLEPNGFVHTWENVGDSAGAILQANVSPEGAPEIIPVQPR